MKIEDEIQSKFKSDYHKLIVNLHFTYSRITEPLQQLLKQHNITSTQYNVLRILRGQKQVPASIGLIKERMIERNSDVSRVIDRLLKKNLIERKENKLDRRQRDVIINEDGLELLALIDETDYDFVKAFDHISLEEVKLMNDLLDKIRTKPEAE
ncbi:MarR family winged helix-turn-helix transcriptional regulator [Crocinitomix algicola]|uniref:MarR family winged helix-turn-helix transcriptional regulator n=1 Tax=Crocinitomix algicola TaxID=1740263 RepID=UPI00082E4076|nr:MarR family transcriptional regulator [Crocinitomix algicola]